MRYSGRCVAILRFVPFTPRMADGTSSRSFAPTVSKRLIASWVAFVSSTESPTLKRACYCRPISLESLRVRDSAPSAAGGIQLFDCGRVQFQSSGGNQFTELIYRSCACNWRSDAGPRDLPRQRNTGGRSAVAPSHIIQCGKNPQTPFIEKLVDDTFSARALTGVSGRAVFSGEKS